MFTLDHFIVVFYTCILFAVFFAILYGKPSQKTSILILGFTAEVICAYFFGSIVPRWFHWHWIFASCIITGLLTLFIWHTYRSDPHISFWSVLLIAILIDCSTRALAILVDYIMDIQPYISPKAEFFSALAYRLLALLVIIILALFWKKNKIFPSAKTSKMNICILIMPVLMQYFVYDYYRTFPLHNTAFPRLLVLYQLTLASMITIICLALTYQEQTIRNQITKELLCASQNQMDSLMQKEEEIKGLRHDLKNHFLVLQRLYQEQKYEEAKQYIDTIQASALTASTRIYCPDPFLNALLNEKISQKPPIKFEIAIDPVCIRFFESIDLCILIGNLLDNAIREISTHPDLDPTIMVSFIQTNIGAWLRVENPLYLKKSLKSDKQDSSKHGLGLSIIKNIVDKYHGNLSIKQNERFLVSILFQEYDS